MSDELIESPQAAVDAAAASWAKHHAEKTNPVEILDRAQRYAEALAFDEDAARRSVAVELIEILGVPQ